MVRDTAALLMESGDHLVHNKLVDCLPSLDAGEESGGPDAHGRVFPAQGA